MRSIPLHSLVLMVGLKEFGRSNIAHEKFDSYEIINSEKILHDLVGDITRTDLSKIVLREVNQLASIKLKLGERAVIDADNLEYRDRMNAASIGLNMGVPTYYVVVNNESDVIVSNERMNLFNQVERDVLYGDNLVNVIDTRVDTFSAVKKLPNTNLLDYIKDQGYKGLCIVPDVHGMLESLKQAIDWARGRGLFLVFLGDVLDYGPESIDCIYLVYDLVMRGRAIFTIGNHEKKIERWLDQQARIQYDSRGVKNKTSLRLSEGNKVTTMVIEKMNKAERNKFESRFRALVAHGRNHWVIDNRMLFTHAACEPEMFDLNTSRLYGSYESKALYGEISTISPQQEDGYPNRIYEWVDRIPKGKIVLVGHDIRSKIKPLLVSGALGGEAYFMDTGSGKGGRLSTADILFKDENLDVQNFTAH